MGLAFILCVVLYMLFYLAGQRQAKRVNEAIRVKVRDSGSSHINPEAVDQ